MNLLLTGCFNYSNEQLEAIRLLGFSIYFMKQENENLPLAASEIDAIVCNGLFLSHDIHNFSALKFIQLTSAGYDRVPIDTIKSYGIELHNAKGVYGIPMAEWAVFRVLEHYKQSWFFKKNQENICWTKHRGLKEIFGSKIAIIGAGNIGQEVAKRFQVFGAEITGFDIHTNHIPHFNCMKLTDKLKENISVFDVVIVTAPLLPSTKGLINYEIMMAMKKNATLINISRGGLIDEKALCEVLVKRKDLFVALDVFEQEPLANDSPLWTFENVGISPHNSFVSNGNNARMFDIMYNNLKSFLENNEKVYINFTEK